MQKTAGIVLCSAFFLLMTQGSCTEADSNIESTSSVSTRLTLKEGSTIDEARAIINQVGAERMEIRVRYPDHQVTHNIELSDESSKQSLYESEHARLTFLIANFDPSDTLEGPIHGQLVADLSTLERTRNIEVKWVELKGYFTPKAEYIVETTHVSNSDPGSISTTSNVGIVSRAITDYTGDAWWTPAGGTSRISTSGTLQKFWLDSAAKSIINNYKSGLEMDTLITGKNNASCNTSGVSSNMPDYYADTEASDTSNFRNCSVGTISANQLQTGVLYWTWHPFGFLNTSVNPQVTVEYQAREWCFWVTSKAQCSLNKPWCMCEIGNSTHQNLYPTQWLIQYYYNEAPNREVSWTKN